MKFRMLMNKEDDVTQAGGTGAPTETPVVTPAETEPKAADPDPAGDEPLELFPEDKDEFTKGIDIQVEEYELELAEESMIPEAEFDALVEAAKNEGLTKEEAQARMALMEKSYKTAEDSFVKKRSDSLKEDLYKHEYFDTAEKRKTAQEDIARALKEYKSPELAKLVKEDPFFRHHPTLMKLLVDMGRSLRADTAPLGNQEGAKTAGGDAQADYYKQYYPSMFTEQK